MEHVTKSPEETKNLGHFLINGLSFEKRKGAIVIALEGELGAGKTTFVQGLARLLGIEAKIKSPTFNLIKKYHIKLPKRLQKTKLKILNSRFLYHLDCYRLKNHKDLLVLGIKDILKNKENVLLIEWPERVKKILPPKHIRIKFDHINKNTRKIIIK